MNGDTTSINGIIEFLTSGTLSAGTGTSLGTRV